MEEKKYYALSKEQEGLVMLAGLFPFPNLLYLFSEIDFVSEISEERLLEAIRLTGERLPYCRVRLHDMDDGSCMQYCSDEAPDPVEIIDLSQGTEEELESLKLQWQKESFPNNQRDTQLYRFRLVRMPGGKHILHLVVHHFIMDAFSMMNTVRYVDEVYSALSRGEELPPEGPLPWKLLEEENAYFGSKKEERDGEWWRAQYETEPMFCSVNGLGGPEFVEGKRYGRKQSFSQMFTELLRRRIPKELVDRVNASAAERKLSPQVYYMLAECKLRAGDANGAKDLVNQVRKRYFKASDWTSVQNEPGPGFSAFDLDWMLNEWGKEFLCEGRRRRTDLRRYDVFTQGQWWFFGRGEGDDAYPAKRDRKYEWFPLPEAALTVNPGLVQNPNYVAQ